MLLCSNELLVVQREKGTSLFAAASDCRGSLRRPSLGRLECSSLSHLRQQRLQLISQPNNVLLVMSRPPSSW
jgi:hypothetical protein